MVAEGRLHLNFMIEIDKAQLEGGRFFLHEHPSTAASWNEDSMARLVSDPRIYSITSHQCEYGLTVPGPNGEPLPALKPTRWISNSQWMIKRLSRRCSKDHAHQPLTGRHKTRPAEMYSLELCVEFLRGMRDTDDAAFHRDDKDDSLMSHANWVNSLQTSAPCNDHALDDVCNDPAPVHAIKQPNKKTHPTTTQQDHTNDRERHTQPTDLAHQPIAKDYHVTLKHANGSTEDIDVNN